MTTRTLPETDRQPLTVDDIRNRGTISAWPDAGEVLGIGRALIYSGIASGEIPSVRVGRRVLVPVPALLRMLGDTAA
jgi:excisionase family DNA binding protein